MLINAKASSIQIYMRTGVARSYWGSQNKCAHVLKKMCLSTVVSFVSISFSDLLWSRDVPVTPTFEAGPDFCLFQVGG